MATTTTTAAELIKPVVAAGFVEGAFRQSAPLSYFGAPQPSGGDSSYRWKINSVGNTSAAVYTEGQALAGSGNQSWVTAADPYLSVRFEFEITGHARAALRSNYVDAIAAELSLGTRDLVHLVNTTAISGTNGLETAVDSSTAYAGITRGAASYFESYETTPASGAALAVTDLEDMLEALGDNDRGASTRAVAFMVPWNQATNIYRLTGTPATQFIGDADKAPSFLSQTFAGQPVIPVPNWTDTVIMGLDLSPGNFVFVEHQPIMVHDQGRSADADLFLVTYMFKLVCKAPKLMGKLTGVTA